MHLIRWTAVAGLCLLAATSVHAQTGGASPYHFKDEIFAGGNFLRTPGGPGLDSSSLGGWDVTYTRFVTPLLGLMAEGQGNYGQAATAGDPSFSQHATLGGLQFRWRRRARTSSSFRFLAGAVHSDGDSTPALYPTATKLALKMGGTFDFHLTRRVSLRIAPGAMLQRRDGGFDRSFALSAGLVFRLGR